MLTHQPSEKWFLAQLRPNCHAMATRNLTRQGFPTFLPMHHETIRQGDRFATTRRPLFPGYIFIALDPAQGKWRAVNSTVGITKLVSFGAAPAPLPDALVAGLVQRCDSTGTLIPPAPLQPGESVTIMSGPFVNFVATVETIASDKRVWLLLDFLGQQTRLAVDGQTLQPIRQ